jgi:cytochrome c-type biogenesis protein CcmH
VSRRGLRALVPALAAVIALAGVLVGPGGFVGRAAPTLDDQVYDIAKDLMCPVCAGQTVAESNSPLAIQMRQIIRDRLRQGQTREQIIAYFVEQFGESVLARPPRRGAALLVWMWPLVAFAAGALVLRRFLRRSVKAARRPPPPAPPSPQEAEQITRALRELD